MMNRPIASHVLSSSSRWALTVIVIGVLITAVDTTIVVLALPTIMRTLHANLRGVVWVVMAYLLVITLVATQVGRLGDMFGRVRMYELGFLIFIVGSLLCGIVTSVTTLVVFRIVQGVGGALVTANSGAVIADHFPPERRGKAYGYTSIGWSIGAILGILLGGFITTYWSWRYIFLINVPIGLAAVAISWVVLRDHGQRVSRNLDGLGMVLLGVGLFLVLLTMVHLSSHPPSLAMVATLAGGFVSLAAFARYERHHPFPMLNLELFKNRVISASFMATFFQALGNYAVLFLLIMYLQGIRSLTPLDASLLMVPGYLVGGILGPWAGRLADRIGPSVPATVGLGIQALAMFWYARLGVASPLWWVAAASLINGIGGSGFYPANNAAVMKGAPAGAYGIASGMLRTFANIGMVLSFATAILIASTHIPRGVAFAIFVGTSSLHGRILQSFNGGLHAAFYVAIGLFIVAGLCSSLRGPAAITADPPELPV